MINKKRQTIMLVDDNQANLNIGKNMLKEFYEVYALPSAERLFKFLETVTPDLILLDIAMPGMNGFDVIRILKADAKHAGIPVIFVTAKAEEMNELEGLNLGAVDYVTKPFSASILLKRIENHLLIARQKVELKVLNDSLIKIVREKTAQVSGLQSSIIDTIAELIEFRDDITGGHINLTQQYMELLMDYMVKNNVYFDEILLWDNMDYIVPSTQLHDIGKIFISDVLLNKPGKLTASEFEIMKTHVEKGVEAIRRLKTTNGEQPFLDYAEIVAGYHHEKWNGSGYPYGLKGENIPLLGRMMALADVYDALTSTRPYKPPVDTEEAAKIIIESSGSHFDPILTDIFKKLEGEFARIAKTAVPGKDGEGADSL